MVIKTVVSVIAYLVLAPFVGGFLTGWGRKILAGAQGKKGHSVIQPLYDVKKLLGKKTDSDKYIHDYYVKIFLLFVIISGSAFFAGADMLFVILAFLVADVFFITASYTSNSKYAQMGAEHELVNILVSSPMVLIGAVGFYMYCGSMNIRDILMGSFMPVFPLIGIFIGVAVLFVIRLKKSSFGPETYGFSGKTLAYTEIGRWYGTVTAAGFIFLFFSNGKFWGYLIGAAAVVIVYSVCVLIAGSLSDMKWKTAVKAAWIIAVVLGIINLFMLYVTM